MKERMRQIRIVWQEVRREDPRILPWVLAGGVLGLLVGIGIGFLLPVWTFVTVPLLGLLLMLLGGMLVFTRRAGKAQYAMLDGQVGAAAAVLQSLRGQWFVQPAVAVNAKQDMVHRVIGRPGVILVGEGSHQRVKGLLAKERKRLSRLVRDEVEIHTLIVGDGDDQVPLNKLQSRVSRLKGSMKRTEVPKLERRIRSLDREMPIPKGVDPMSAMNRRRPRPR